jgi:hypothetical protein
MDRIEFIHSINPNHITTKDLIIDYLDQSMLLYDLVPEDSTVSVSDNNLDLISFDVYTTKKNIIKLSNYLTNNPVIVEYRKPINLNFTQSDNILSITMRV